MVTEFNSIQKYYQKKKIPGIILRGLSSIYAIYCINTINYIYHTSYIHSRFTTKLKKSLSLTQNFNKIKH